MSGKAGVLLVGHGTRNDSGAAEFELLVHELRRQVGAQAVEGCFLELRPPGIASAWQRLLEAGVMHVHVAPLLLFAAGHAKQDIPAAIERCAAATPEVGFDFARPLSRHRLIVEFAAERAMQAWRERPSAVAACAADRVVLVLVGRGSYDPCAQADMRVFTELVRRRLPFPRAETAFYAMANPSLPELLNRIVRSGEVQAVLVQPHILFQGAIRDAIGRQVSEASERHRQVTFLTLPHMGPDHRVAAAIAARIKDTLAN